MSDSNSEGNVEPTAPKAKVRPARRFSIIWLIPLVTLAAAGWIGYRTISERGPMISITFETADGLEAGKTKVIFKGVQVGTVESIGISDDLSHAIVRARMVKGAKKHLTEGTLFWVVRPEVSLGHISGLGTLVSGAYIAVKPGDGERTLSFKGLDRPPIADSPGRRFVLRAERIGSLHVSSPVYHRGIPVGEVLSYELDKDGGGIAISILIKDPHVDLVRKSSVFWNSGGIDVNLGNLFDASISVGSFESLLSGGIAFDNPPGVSEPAPAEAVFRLQPKRPMQFESLAVEDGLKLVLTTDLLRGVKAGDAVTYRHVNVGKVVATRLAKDGAGVEIDVSIAPDHASLVRENSQFWNASGITLNFGNIVNPSLEIGSLESLVAGGVAFRTPSEPGAPVKSGHRFALLTKQPEDLTAAAAKEAEAFKVILSADDLGGVNKGDPVFYKHVPIGQVLKTQLNASASGVEIELGIEPTRANLIHTNTVFWNASGLRVNFGDLADASVDIESLKSLIAGGIALANPVDAGAQAQSGARYPLNPKRPDEMFLAKKTDEALHIVLRSELQGSVKVDDPILYREVQVGTVTGIDLSEDADYVALQVAIDPRYASLVRAKTVFWNASGIHASFGLFSGADIDIESLSALLRGGIAFATPKDGGEAAKTGAVYELYPEPKKEWQAWAPHIRLPKEPPKETSGEGAGANGNVEAPAQPEAAAGEVKAGEEAPAGEQTAETPSDATADMPTALPLSGEHVSVVALSEALGEAGFTNIGNIEKSGSIVRAQADWQGETVTLRIDTRTGRIERAE
jgi:paraquat-inducible protein B